MIKLFISQPMKGKSDAEILAVRQQAIQSARRNLGVEVEIIDSFFQNAPADAKPLWYLSKSLELLSTADVAYFAPGWETARGCKIENECAIAYGITVIEDYTQGRKSEGVTITPEQYHQAVIQTMEEEAASPATQGMGKLLIPMVGAIFAKKIEEKLFNKEGKNNG